MTAATNIDFTLQVDQRGYELVPDRTPKLRPGQRRMWDDIRPAKIVGNGGRKIKKRLDEYPALYIKFADVRTSADLLAFVTQYGPLSQRRTGGWERDIVPLVLREAERFRSQFEERAAKIKNPISDIDCKAWLSADLTVNYGPATLLDALWLQFAQSLSEGTELRRCRHCHKTFAVGGQSRKRLVAKFCREESQVTFNSLKRSRKS